MVGHGKQGFCAKAQAFAFHGGGNHLKGFTRAHFVGQERVAAVKHMGNSVQLMFPQGNLRVNAAKGDVPPIILAGPDGVVELVIFVYQRVTAARVPPYPILKDILDCLLLLLGQCGFLLVQYTAFPAILVLYGIVDTHIAQV